MASKTNTPLVIFLALNLLFFALASGCSTCSSPPTPKPNPSGATCPKDALKLGICANVLGSLLGVVVGDPPVKPCCSLIEGLVDLEAAVCLCTAIKANVLGINLNVPLSLSLLLNVCSKKVPKDFQYMDLISLIRAPNPTKVKVGSRPGAPHEVPLLTLTANRVSEMDDPATASESSGVPPTIERSPLDFSLEAGASNQGTAA
nr:hypothetical protein [Tanacetum cinerariifolium]